MSLQDRIREHVNSLEGVHRLGIPEAQAFLETVDQRTRTAWLKAREAELVALEMQRYALSLRGQARARGKAREFDDLADSVPAEDVHARFKVDYEITPGDRMWLRDMTAEDLHAAADRLEARAHTIAMEGAILRAIAKRLKKGQTVADVWQPEELDDLFQAA